MTSSEPITLVVAPRDRFSTTETCLRNLLQHTPVPFELIIFMPGAPEHIRRRLESAFAARAKLIFPGRFLNASEVRNQALRLSRTRLTVFVDTDIYVRSGWLEPLIQCQAETGAAMVAPVILDRQNLIHSAGNELYITYQNGLAYGSMEVRFQNQNYCQSSNLKRAELDCAEIHCQLVITRKALDERIYDERLREAIELNAGLTLKKAGLKSVTEPRSAVYFHYIERITDADDIALHLWKWDDRAMLESMAIIKDKWGVDLNLNGRYAKYLRSIRTRVGWLARVWPTPQAVFMDRAVHRVVKNIYLRFAAS